ncbi:hypothetical protein [Caproicibacter fermentans]|uniref:Uncharacterized protein n=1 Tax=Caproicibacter fermentans TaxID=2576756 RepID=A0A7G8T6W1_9FIRM|nr:hypothetical protein [Caproicibacter fermentans]QNK39352.1 hypothetical protein HCR03_11355 [Caproicibacter fermentans]
MDYSEGRFVPLPRQLFRTSIGQNKKEEQKCERLGKKQLSLVLVFALSMMVCVPAFAAESSNNDTEKFNVNIYSEEYPNAYIEQSFSPALLIHSLIKAMYGDS